MRGLYKATAMVIMDEQLRSSISALAKTVQTDKPGILKFQPDLAAVGEIDKLFQARGLVLPIYDLCEINRWFVEDQDQSNPEKFSKALGRFQVAMQVPIQVGTLAQGSGFLEALGVMVVDVQLRTKFALGNLNLSDLGFVISKTEEDSLRQSAQLGGIADKAANDIRDLGWQGGSCMSPLLAYPGMVHPNT